MKQILFLVLFGLAACGAYTPNRRYPTSQYTQPTNQYNPAASQYINPSQPQVPILRQESNNNGDGIYSYAYQTANGISAQEQGDARSAGTRAQGGFAYTSPNGQPIQIQYTADENGFIPQGDHLPAGLTGPILKSIQQNLADERRGVVDNGQYKADQSQGYGQQQYNTAQYTVTQKAPVKYVAPQKYNTPTRYNTPQKYNTAQQYRVPQTTQNKYAGTSYNRRPQTGYKF